MFEIAEQGARGRQGFQEMPPLLTQVVERIDLLYNRQGDSDVTGVATGFVDLDRMTSGLQPGDLVIVAGRPSMGKAQPLDAKIKTSTAGSRWAICGSGMSWLRSTDAVLSSAAFFRKGGSQVYRVTFSDGRSTECCAEHLWKVYYRDWPEPRVLTTERVMAMLKTVALQASTLDRYSRRELWACQRTAHGSVVAGRIARRRKTVRVAR